MGVELSEFMDHTVGPDDIQVRGVLDDKGRKLLKKELLDLPLSCLPRWDAPSEPMNQKGVNLQGALVMRAFDYEMFKSEWDGILLSEKEAPRQTINLTNDGCSFVLVSMDAQRTK